MTEISEVVSKSSCNFRWMLADVSGISLVDRWYLLGQTMRGSMSLVSLLKPSSSAMEND